MRSGGRYEVPEGGGAPKRVEGTEPDKRGDRARDADGKALNGREDDRTAPKANAKKQIGAKAPPDGGREDIEAPSPPSERRKAKES